MQPSLISYWFRVSSPEAYPHKPLLDQMFA
jgi:hypothetical protein